ncbi:MAG: hypothetical protein R3C11_22585 [Planctomycetaceae bacterium]
MRRVLSITFVLVLLLLIGIWFFMDRNQYPTELTSGTAATVADLRTQIPLHESLKDLPEVGPFHWEGPYNSTVYQNEFHIYGKASDIWMLIRWLDLDRHRDPAELKSSIEPEEVTNLAVVSSTEFGISVESDGTFDIGYGNYNPPQESQFNSTFGEKLFFFIVTIFMILIMILIFRTVRRIET